VLTHLHDELGIRSGEHLTRGKKICHQSLVDGHDLTPTSRIKKHLTALAKQPQARHRLSLIDDLHQLRKRTGL
jgi:hypothetical protein